MTKAKIEAASALKNLADLFKIDLKNSRLAIATVRESATVRMYDGSLEARLVPSVRGTVYITSPRSPGICIDLVDHQRDVLAPAEAIYSIAAYMPNPDGNEPGTALNGHVYNIYIGKNGIILDDNGLKRASEIFQKKK